MNGAGRVAERGLEGSRCTGGGGDKTLIDQQKNIFVL